VQRELRKPEKNRYRGEGAFAGKIKCGECGAWFGRKVWHSNSKYRRVVYQCNNKYTKRSEQKCQTPHLYEQKLKEIFANVSQNEKFIDFATVYNANDIRFTFKENHPKR
jgi:hypothetical protein